MVELSALVSQIVSYIAIYVIIVIALNIKAGLTGIPDFGHAMFFGISGIVVGNIVAHIAAYLAGIDVSLVLEENAKALAVLNTEFFPNRPLESVLLLLFAITLSMLLGGLLGWLASYPGLRLKGEYLAILLLTAAEAVRVFVMYTREIMGSTPRVGLTTPQLLAWTGNPELYSTMLTVLVAVGVFIYAQRFYNSPAGRLLRAVRDDEDAVRALGKDIVKARRDAMIIGSSLAALAGVMYTMTPIIGGSSISANDVFNRLAWTFWPWAIMIVGGMASNKGIVVATIILWTTILWPIRIYKHQLTSILGLEGIDPSYFANALEYLFMGLLLILIIFFRPQGIIPEPPSRTINPSEIARLLKRPRQPASSENGGE